MGKEKFYYNKQTLRYEKLEEPLKVRILKIAGLSFLVLLAGSVIAGLAFKYMDSPEVDKLKRELKQMEVQNMALDNQVDQMGKVLTNIQDRDANVHRMMFGMDPIDEDVWNGGVGGSEKYDYLTEFSDSGDLLRATQEKADRLKRQLVIQSQSLDKIELEAESKEAMLSSIPAIKPVREDKLARGIRALSGFGRRIHPIQKIPKMHYGIDFTAPRGTPIHSTGDGKVEKILYKKTGYGTHVIINHGYGYKTLYAHMSKVDVKVGDEVKRGNVIGKVGNTGSSTAPHCHYEVIYQGQKVNPLNYCLDGLTPEEYQQLANMASVNNQSFD